MVPHETLIPSRHASAFASWPAQGILFRSKSLRFGLACHPAGWAIPQFLVPKFVSFSWSGSHWFGIFHTNDGLPNCSTIASDVLQSASSRQTFQACSREWCSKSIPRHGNPPVTSKNSRLPRIRLFLGLVFWRSGQNYPGILVFTSK